MGKHKAIYPASLQCVWENKAKLLIKEWKFVMKSLMVSLAVLTATSAWGHHSFNAEFDDKKPVTLEGVVTQMEWVNPHTWIHLDVKNPDGSVSNWAVEGNSPNILIRKGFTKDTLKPGTEIVVQGYQAKRGGPLANGSSITLKDGRKLFLGSSADEGPGAKK